MSVMMTLAPPTVRLSVSVLIARGIIASDAVVTLVPANEKAVIESTAKSGTTCCSKMLLSTSVLSNNVSIVSCPNIAKASSVGANTVKVLSESPSTPSNSAACNAATKVVKRPSATAVSTMFIVGSALAAGGIKTASITWIMPLSVIMSVCVTVTVLTNKLSPLNDNPIFAPFTVSTVVPAAAIAAAASTSEASTW